MKLKMAKIIILMEIMLLLAYSTSFPCSGSVHTASAVNESGDGSLAYHDPISISSNQGLIYLAVADGWPGNGSENNPYVIENYIFDNPAPYQISISNVDLYFTIRNNNINNGLDGGIYIANSRNGLINDNNLYNNGYDVTHSSDAGIKIDDSSSDLVIENNTVIRSFSGIFLWNNVNNTVIINNTVLDCQSSALGIAHASTNNNITGNRADTAKYGVLVYQGAGGHLIANNTLNNCFYGLRIDSSARNVVTNNAIQHSTSTGIYLYPVADDNVLVYNNVSGSEILGLKVEGVRNNITLNNFFDGPDLVNIQFPELNTIILNYWQIGDSIIDQNNDGINDEALYLAGKNSVLDPFPIVNPVKYDQRISFTVTDSTTTTSTGTSPEKVSYSIIGSFFALFAVSFLISSRRKSKNQN